MSLSYYLLALMFNISGCLAAAVTYDIPASKPIGAATLDPAPVSLSFEFFTFPSYFTNVTATNQCLQNLQELTGTWPPIRIGGTTQDRAVYDPDTDAYVVYSVPTATTAPSNLTFGKSFMTLAGTYQGSVVLGLNRGHDNLTNTIAAAQVAKSSMSNLLAIELGNEPEYWLSAGQEIATNLGTWTAATDAESQDNWDIAVGTALNTPSIIQAGTSLMNPPAWGAAELIATENCTAQGFVKSYSHHNYPGGTVQSLMSHTNVVKNVAGCKSLVLILELKGADVDSVVNTDREAATAIGKEYVFGETNSVSGGGAAGVSPTFGAALWTMDYILQASLSNITRTYFHHGTLGACYYCFWGKFDMGAPYYGAYAATAFMANASSISSISPTTTPYATYIAYSTTNAPLRALLYNSDYYNGTGTRTSQEFVLTGIPSGTTTVTAKRLTSANALSRIDQGAAVTFGGQSFANGDCVRGGDEVVESVVVSGGMASFVVNASEALVVSF